MAGIDMTMSPKSRQVILAINSGSSSLKIAFFDGETQLLSGSAEGVGHADGRLRLVDGGGQFILDEQHSFKSQEEALGRMIEICRGHVQGAPIAIGHRIVHGGPELQEHQPITPAVLAKLAAAEHFAPLHLPQALRLIRHTQQAFPEARQIACFDTAFHRNMPEAARRLPLPIEFDRRGVRRYGFHGLSYESLVRRLGDRLPGRTVFAHLGSGSSLCAMRNGKSIDTSMGMTPTGGVVMGTRSGDLDPGVLLFLLRTEKLSIDDLEELLNHRAGLVGLSGGESDMQRMLALRKAGDPLAELAVTAYCNSIRKTVGAYAALLGGVDLLVFTGGIGAHSQEIRSLVCAELGFLGVSGDGEKVKALPTEEELQIARICSRWV